jgi:iron complex transport system substrate-binding protein
MPAQLRTIRHVTLAVGIVTLALSGFCAPDQDKSAGLTVKDSLGRIIAVPSKVERIVSVQPEISRIIVALGARERLVGIEYALQKYDPLFQFVFPAARNLPIVSVAEDSVNLEMVLQLKPDVIFVSPFEKHIVEVLEKKSRIPVIALASLGNLTRLAEEIRLTGKIIGCQAEAEEVASFFEKTLDAVRRPLASLPEGAKPRVYLSFWGSLTKTPVLYQPVNAAGGVNVAEGLLPSFLGSIGTVVSIEEIIRWNPDVILIHGNYLPEERTVTVEGVLRDPRLSSIDAVKNRKVFYTFGFWNWWDPAEVLVEVSYLASRFHPELVPDRRLETEANRIFKKFYKIADGYSRLCRILRCDEWSDEE